MTARTLVTGALATGLVAAGAALAGVPGVAAATSATDAVCNAVPADLRLIAASPTVGVMAISAAGEQTLPMELPAPPIIAARSPDGTTWVQVTETGGELGFGQVLRVARDGTVTAVVDSASSRLFDAGQAGGRDAALVADYAVGDQDDDSWGATYLAYADGELVDLGPAGGPEYGIAAMSLGNDTIAETAWADLTEIFTFRDLSGAVVDDFYNPADGATYNDVPLWLWPALSDVVSSADPVLLSWTEGPDYAAGMDWNAPVLTGNWTVNVADALAGTPFYRVELPIPETLSLYQASFDGRFWVGSVGPRTNALDAMATYAIDFAKIAPTPIDLQCASDVIATIDRSDPDAVAPPTSSPTPSQRPSTTAPPASQQPSSGSSGGLGCGGAYSAADGTLPVRRCTSGVPVEIVQTLLNRAGYSVTVDGYFGPNTATTVIEFQRDHGLAPDSLVGPRTWPALLTAAGIDPDDLSYDSNGNGSLDPTDAALLSG